ncbi:MAG: N-acetylmuramoyl-L-alanine amidase family protein [Chloroflexota bacterium]
MAASGARLIPLLALVLVITSCGTHPLDDGYAFLASNRSDWLRGTPAPVQPASVVGATPTAGAQASAPAVANNGPILVYLDPGHGGVDTGTIGTTSDGTTVEEKNIALAIALKTADHLRANGIGVMLSRTDDSLPGSTPADYSADGKMLTPDGVLADLQRRIDRANESGARVLLSIHLNGFTDPSVGGAETFYDPSRPFGDESKRFATLVQNTLIADLRARGYDTPDRGVTNDEDLQTESLGSLAGNYNHLVLLGPAVPGRLRPSQMPGALSEPLFLSNPPEATAVSQADVQDLIATSYATAVEAFLNRSEAAAASPAPR